MGQACFSAFDHRKVKLPWHSAREYCMARDSDLASFDSFEEFNAVGAKLRMCDLAVRIVLRVKVFFSQLTDLNLFSLA